VIKLKTTSTWQWRSCIKHFGDPLMFWRQIFSEVNRFHTCVICHSLLRSIKRSTGGKRSVCKLATLYFSKCTENEYIRYRHLCINVIPDCCTSVRRIRPRMRTEHFRSAKDKFRHSRRRSVYTAQTPFHTSDPWMLQQTKYGYLLHNRSTPLPNCMADSLFFLFSSLRNAKKQQWWIFKQVRM